MKNECLFYFIVLLMMSGTYMYFIDSSGNMVRHRSGFWSIHWSSYPYLSINNVTSLLS